PWNFNESMSYMILNIIISADYSWKKAIEVCRREQLGYLWLGVWEHNAAAIRFYEKQGFKMCRTHQFTLGADVQTDYIMKLTV
ncbi:MAG: GNAT family N-acetyltransferase, partial [Erysipelotrichaceae bacterium]|nr:GNAT family N-acetyltransferase [Erysipelotrichaceae bacterium]